MLNEQRNQQKLVQAHKAIQKARNSARKPKEGDDNVACQERLEQLKSQKEANDAELERLRSEIEEKINSSQKQLLGETI